MNTSLSLSPQRSTPTLHTALLAAVVLISGLVAFSAHTPSAEATTVLKLDTEGLSTLSESIAMARVESTTTIRRGGTIITQVQARVVLPIKGSVSKGSLVTIERVGGRKDGFVQMVPGAADYERGEDILVFMERPQGGTSSITAGMAQGKYKIALGPDEKLWAIRDTSHLSFAAIEELPNGGKRAVLLDHDDVDQAGALPLQTLLIDITDALKTQDVQAHTDVLKRLDRELYPQGYNFELDFKNLPTRTTTNVEVP